jgi:hypothetical protein
MASSASGTRTEEASTKTIEPPDPVTGLAAAISRPGVAGSAGTAPAAGSAAAGPVRDKGLRRGEPQTAAAAGDEVDPAVESKIHPPIRPVRGR